MPRTDRSTTILTGMIIAALYVILLIGFSRESYMRRDAAQLAAGAGGPPPVRDALGRACPIEPPICRANEPARPPGLHETLRAMLDDL
jgi:hypothetical protein